MTIIAVDSPEIELATLHVKIPLLYHIYALPYLPLYPLLAYAYYVKYDSWLGSEEWTFLACVAVFGGHALSFLITRWSVGARAWVTSKQAKGLQDANCIRVVPPKHRGKAEIVPLAGDGTRFMYNHAVYTLDTTAHDQIKFTPLPYPSSSHPPLKDFQTHPSKLALSSEEIESKTALFGSNKFTIPIPTFAALFGEHATAPFFVFQIFCVGLWCLDEYWYYSLFTLFMLVVFECTVVWQRVRTLTEFMTMSVEPFPIPVLRGGKWETIQSDTLVPGDVVSLARQSGTGKAEMTVPADLLLLQGSAIVNEAMLSGESTPLVKESIALLPPSATLHLDDAHKAHALFGGTKLLQSSNFNSNTNLNANNDELVTPDNGCVALVLRTGFGTAQGSLVRTMIFATERVSANNLESFLFIGFLLLFALASASYVWVNGAAVGLKKGKLLLHCILIVTSVVPPELPMELSLAVNASLVALGKYAIFCTEPFRIPFAGRVDVVAFDKTGTLTGSEMVVEGVGGVDSKNPRALAPITSVPSSTTLTIAAAHALVRIIDTSAEGEAANGSATTTKGSSKNEDGTIIVGDPMEKASLDAMGWVLEEGSIVRALSKSEWEEREEKLNKKKGNGPQTQPQPQAQQNGNAQTKKVPQKKKEQWSPHTSSTPFLTIRRRFAFSSALKRMSTVATIHMPSSAHAKKTIIAVKGAPETIKGMIKERGVPEWYEETYKWYTRRGGRVLALGLREEGAWGIDKINKLQREEVERDLTFVGFLVFHCPLKPDAIESVKMIGDASHRCIMITGDNPLTAAHVARDVEIVDRDEVMVLDVREEQGDLVWHTIDDSKLIPVNPSEPLDRPILDSYDICVTGTALKIFEAPEHAPRLHDIVTHAYVYARVSPAQKEIILTTLNSLGYITLMAGDGTNDVGALKQAHVGVALLDGTPEDLQRIAEKARIERVKKVYESQLKISVRFGQAPPPVPPVLKQYYPELSEAREKAGEEMQERRRQNPMEKFDLNSITDKMADMEGEDEPPKIKLGDASCAAPFTSKLSNVSSIVNIIRQGRCTLVATIQMYKILALNCLITAYSLSVQHLDGIKFGDYQVTITGMLMSVCFYCISRAKPVEKLSRERPLTNIFNLYVLLSVLIQFAIHIATMLYITFLSYKYEERGAIDLDAKFEPNLLNTAIFLLGTSQQVSTFAINFQGRPFREGIRENPALFWGLVGASAVAFCGSTDFVPELNRWLQVVEMKTPFMVRLTAAMIIDMAGCWIVEIVCKHLFADLEPKEFITRGRERREVRRKEELRSNGKLPEISANVKKTQ